MPIHLGPHGFFEWHDFVKDEPGIGMDSDRVGQCLKYFHESGFRGLFGHQSFGFRQDNLDFLSHTPNAQWLWFWDVSLKQIDAIYELRKLKSIGIHPKRPGIDFCRFPVLHTAVNHWLKNDRGITESTIKELDLWRFKSSTKTFDGLEIPQAIKKLSFYWANPISLSGLPVMPTLESLEIHNCRNLVDLSSLPWVAPNLQRLLVTSSSRVQATTGVLDHPTLKFATVAGHSVLART